MSPYQVMCSGWFGTAEIGRGQGESVRIQLSGNLKEYADVSEQGPRRVHLNEGSERAAAGSGVHVMDGQAESLSVSTETATGSGDVPRREMNPSGTRQLRGLPQPFWVLDWTCICYLHVGDVHLTGFTAPETTRTGNPRRNANSGLKRQFML